MARSLPRRVTAAALVIPLALSLGGCKDGPAHKAKKKAAPIIATPKRPPVKGQCGIPHALKAAPPGNGDCVPPYTYTLFAQSAGIKPTYVDWHIGPERQPVFVDRFLITTHLLEKRSTVVRYDAYVHIYAVRSSVLAANGHYGTGCYIAVRDSKGEQVGQDVVQTRPREPYTYRPYEQAICYWH